MTGQTTETDQTAYHYGVIARAIAIIERAGPGLTLDALAAELGMSPAHFQRVFSRWAGVSPKRFQQYLTLGHARALLADRHTVLDAALATGLSGTGRMHDLFLRWEAMSPGEYASGAAGLDIAWGVFESPFGPVVAMGTGRGLCGLGFAAETGVQAAFDDLARRWPNARFREGQARIAPWVAAAFGRRGEARLHLIGAPFQIKVWEALMQVPDGMVTTYSDIARAIGAPKAVRAVGTAVGRNPVSWLIPCHRALRKTGGLGGYHWGLPVKRALLAWETAQAGERDAA